MQDFTFLTEELKEWLPKVLYRHTEDETLGKCRRLIARQLNASGRDVADVHAVRLDSDDYSSPSAVDMIATELGTALQADADGMGSAVQRYAIYAYFERAPQQPGFRKVVMVAGKGPLENEDGTLTEPPTAVGLTTQLMRHLEIQNKNSMVAMGYLFASQQKQMERLIEANDAKDKRHFNLLMLAEDLISTKHEREMRTEEVKAGIEFKKKAVEKLEVLFPVVMNKFAKTNLYPEKASPAVLAAAAFFDSLSPNQVQVVRQMLSPEQLAALSEVVTSVEKARQGEETAEKKINEIIQDKVIAKAAQAQKQIEAPKPPVETSPIHDPNVPRSLAYLLDRAKTKSPEELEKMLEKLSPEQRSFIKKNLPQVEKYEKKKEELRKPGKKKRKETPHGHEE